MKSSQIIVNSGSTNALETHQDIGIKIESQRTVGLKGISMVTCLLVDRSLVDIKKIGMLWKVEDTGRIIGAKDMKIKVISRTTTMKNILYPLKTSLMLFWEMGRGEE